PNMTYPFGTYCVVVDVDKGTGVVKVRRVVAVDDCGVRINPMIVEGQIHGGLTEGFGIAFTELITFDEDGNCIGSNFMDYLLPTAWETPDFELGATVTPSPHHPLGAKGVGESATVGSPAAYVNAVIDALGADGAPRGAAGAGREDPQGGADRAGHGGHPAGPARRADHGHHLPQRRVAGDLRRAAHAEAAARGVRGQPRRQDPHPAGRSHG